MALEPRARAPREAMEDEGEEAQALAPETASTIGARYASVLPDPVGALTSASLPEHRAGMAEAWTGVGRAKPRERRWAAVEGERPAASNEEDGGGGREEGFFALFDAGAVVPCSSSSSASAAAAASCSAPPCCCPLPAWTSSPRLGCSGAATFAALAFSFLFSSARRFFLASASAAERAGFRISRVSSTKDRKPLRLPTCESPAPR